MKQIMLGWVQMQITFEETPPALARSMGATLRRFKKPRRDPLEQFPISDKAK
jgi:Sec-independent protein translocase protein TatA